MRRSMGIVHGWFRNSFSDYQSQSSEPLSMRCTTSRMCSCRLQRYCYLHHCQYPCVFMKVILTVLLIIACCSYQKVPVGTCAALTEGHGFLFLPPAFRFLKYCKTTEYKCIEQNTLEFWYDLKRYSAWKRNYPESSLWWSSRHPQLAEWLDSEYYRLRVYFVDDN